MVKIVESQADFDAAINGVSFDFLRTTVVRNCKLIVHLEHFGLR